MPQSLSTNKGTVSYSRQEYEVELAAGKTGRKLPSGETEAAIQAIFIEWIDLMIPRFSDPILLQEPIPIKGALGFWNVPDEIEAKINNSKWIAK